MTAQALYHEATLRGLRLKPDGDTLIVSPKTKCPPDFADMLRRHKQELLSWLSSRAAALTPDCAPWVYVARQVLDGEFDGVDRSTRESLIIGLRNIQHPLCRRALGWLQLRKK
jgi:hypothetical protein